MKALIGLSSIGVIECVQHMPAPTPTVEILKIVIQVVLGIATLFKMFKKPKENINPKNDQNGSI